MAYLVFLKTSTLFRIAIQNERRCSRYWRGLERCNWIAKVVEDLRKTDEDPTSTTLFFVCIVLYGHDNDNLNLDLDLDLNLNENENENENYNKKDDVTICRQDAGGP